MHLGSKVLIFLGLSLAPAVGFSQMDCATGVRIEGVVKDPTGAVVVGAQVQANETTVLSDTAGRYTIACVSPGPTTLLLQAHVR